MDINLLISIVNRSSLPLIRQVYEKNNLDPLITVLGNGTATPGLLDLYGLEPSEKALIGAFVQGSNVRTVFRHAKRSMMIDVPGNGVMMTIPVKSVGGGKTLAYLTGGEELDKSVPVMDFQHELIVIILNSGYTDDVMEKARAAGAGGGTVLHAKGTGAQYAKKFFGVSLAEEKEVILIAEHSEKKSRIMKSIAESMGPTTPAGAIAFSLPVSEIAGIRVLED